MRYVVARRISRRGEGLGNEIFPWAKGYLASEVLGARLVGPSWGVNPRKYYRNFGTSRLDFVLEDCLLAAPHFTFTEQDYIETGELQFDKSIRQWVRKKGLMEKSSFILSVDGMYGGYPAIQNARNFIRSKLLCSRDALRKTYEVASTLDPSKLFVGVHMRGTHGFSVPDPTEDVRSRFNIVVPGAWYMSACAALRDMFGDKIQFHFFTDRGGPEYDAAVAEFNPGQKRQLGLTECSDLILLSNADLRLCSVSSYSLVASFLSEGPYVWYEPQLGFSDGLYSLWSHEKAQLLPSSPSSIAVAAAKAEAADQSDGSNFRGYAMADGDDLPTGLVNQLRRRLQSKIWQSDLLMYGSLPDWTRCRTR